MGICTRDSLISDIKVIFNNIGAFGLSTNLHALISKLEQCNIEIEKATVTYQQKIHYNKFQDPDYTKITVIIHARYPSLFETKKLKLLIEAEYKPVTEVIMQPEKINIEIKEVE